MRTNNVCVVGAGPGTMVFGHGLGTDQRAWNLVASAFAQQHRIAGLDHVGFGGSDRQAYAEERHGSLQGYAQDLLDVLSELGPEPVTYLGHSVGGAIGLVASALQPERFERLVLVCTSPCFVNHPPHYHGGFERHDIESLLDVLHRDQRAWADTLAQLAMGHDSTPTSVAEFSHGLRSLDPLITRRFARLAFLSDIRSQLPAVRVPTLIIQCTQDHIVPRSVGHYMRQHIRGSSLREVEATGHCPHLSRPAQIVELVQAFLEQPLE